MKKINHILFDCDGVVLYSERLNFIAWCQALTFYRYNTNNFKNLSHKIILGKPLLEIFKVFEHYVHSNIAQENRENILEKKHEYYTYLAKKELKPVEGINQFLHHLKSIEIKPIIVSSSRLTKIQFSLKTVGLESFFKDIVSGDHGLKKEYASVLKKYNLDPEKTLVFEDVPINIIDAKKSNIKNIIGISSNYSENELYEAGADLVIKNYLIFDLEEYVKKPEH